MVRRVTPSQAKAAVRKLQRSVDDYNRAARKYNAGVKKAVDDYNREVRAYNTRARAHNRRVESDRRRLRQELQRLNSRPTTSPAYTAYRSSSASFVQTFQAVDAQVRSGTASDLDQRFMDLASDEVANSLYVANALDGDGDPASDLSEEELSAPSMGSELRAFGEDLVSRWVGALYSLSPNNPDAARHFCTSAREVVVSMLDQSAPDAAVERDDPNCERTGSGAVTRRAKVSYLLRRQGMAMEGLTNVAAANVENVLKLFRTFNDGTHGHAGKFSITELSAIRIRVESAIGFIHEVVIGQTS